MSPHSSALPRRERLFLLTLLFLACGLRILYAAHFRFDSDEPQHLHVVWGWSQGMLPYRDFFDNHTPLFQALCAPFFSWLGPRADIAIPMRLAMFPLFLGTIWIVARLGQILVSPRAGAWAAAIAALCPPYFLTSIEFRPDQLWTFLWLLTLLVLVGGPFSFRRAWWAGLIMGVSFSVSMKTTLMLGALASGGVALLFWQRPPWRPTAAALGAFLAGIVVVPALVILYFVCHGAGPQFYHGVIGHNVSAGGHITAHLSRRLLRWVGYTALSVLLSLLAVRGTPDPRLRAATFFLAFASLSYYTILKSFWPVLTLEDYIPFYPSLGAAFLPLGIYHASRLPGPKWWLPTALIAIEVVIMVCVVSPLRDDTHDKIGIVADALKLTDPGTFVLDSKGETIYRPRPTFLVMEGLTKRGLNAGRIPNDLQARLIETGTPLITLTRMPHGSTQFLEANYLPIAFRLSVLGKLLYKADPRKPRPPIIQFDLAIPGRYRVLAESGEAGGMLDGQPLAPAQTLAPGHHTLELVSGEGKIALVWAQALERGYSPFAPIKANYRMARD